MDNATLEAVKVCVYLGGLDARGMLSREELHDELVQKMSELDISDEYFSGMQDLIQMFSKFGDDIRAAERKKRPLVRMLGEEIPGDSSE
ncbi:MAG: hypothetical protein JJ866_13000 [Roseibium sp.]|uniref:hypothetical protein n=1 Tax=Roseibium sp. TaxID=1936156 RepID=UPI001B1B295F|nr:hypothetical protein [Roseibium sp.]MBO6892853.1 hypothetical protein [Roseibium sp.]MBO6927954.1 hypothetical protein [Roseibium sp.]